MSLLVRPLRRLFRAAAAAALIPAIVAVFLITSVAGARAEEARGRVTGQITGAEAGAGRAVVLLQYTLDAEGKPKGGPIGRQTSDETGRYTFADVPLEARAVYQLGTRIGEKLVSSKPFTFPEGEREVTLDLNIPQTVENVTGLFIGQALLAVEPGVGHAFVTEVAHLQNPTQNDMDITAHPIELRIPAEADNLEMVRQEQKQGRFQRVKDRLLLYGVVAPGTSTVAFRYRVDVPWGRLSLEKEYPLLVKDFVVLTPQSRLSVSGAGLSARSAQKVGTGSYDAWGRSELPAGLAVRVSVTGLSVRQEVYLWTLPGFLLIMGAVVVVFMRRRLVTAGD